MLSHNRTLEESKKDFMKIRTQADVEQLDERIKNELGIDVRKYRDEEVAENFMELLLFPQYIGSWVLRPVVLLLVLFVVGFFFIDLVHIEYLIYAVFGLALSLLTGLFLGLLLFTWRLKADLKGIVEYALGVMKSGATDLSQVSNKITPENRKDVMGLLFKGVIHIVTIPMMGEVAAQKVPLFGGTVKSLIKKVLNIVSDTVKFDETLLEAELNKEDSEPGFIETYTNSISSATTGLNSVMDKTMGVAQFPLKIGFIISAVSLMTFLYLIW